MINTSTLANAVKALALAAPQAAQIVLFGSHARGDADEGSDLDFLVIENVVENRAHEMVRLRNVMGDMDIGVDLLVYSDLEASRRSQVPGTVLYWAYKEGRVLYDADR